MADDHRPDPDELLARVQAEEAKSRRGRLKVFLGAAAGVGKTYAMLEAAREQVEAGRDVVVGWVQPHGRPETEALLEGLAVVPPRATAYRGVRLEEMDIDGVLARGPALALVDELAHTNAPGSRHARRWQDVEELLEAGIDVYTTVNIQHLESLSDVVAQVTGVAVRETVPDHLVDAADEVELIDLPPDDLLQRLREGKVYVPEQAASAIERFFRKGNLIALRELALRHTANQVDAQMRSYRRDHAIREPWPTAERVLVCVSPSPLSPRLVRAGRRLAAQLRAEWIVAHVETAAHARLPQADRDRVTRTLRLAEQLGAETTLLAGESVSDEILDYARARNVSKIAIGKPERPRWREWLLGSVVDDVIRGSGAIDVYVLSGDADDSLPAVPAYLKPTSPWPAYARALATVAACTLLAAGLWPAFAEANLVMVYLLGVVYVARFGGRGPSILAAVLSVAAFDFFFVAPHLTFTVSDTQYVVTFAVMLVVGLVISAQTVRLRLQAEAARARERRTAALYALSRDLATTRGLDNLLGAAIRHIHSVFDSEVALLLPGDGDLGVRAAEPPSFAVGTDDAGVARWAFGRGRPAGLGTDTLPGASALYLPLRTAQRTIGVLALRPRHVADIQAPERRHFLETFASLVALAIERAHLADESQRARVAAEAERVRGTLLGAVSHDLRTPLTAITGSADALLADGDRLDPRTRRDLLQAIRDEGERLNRLVGNLLDMTRLEAERMPIRSERQSLEEVIGAAFQRMEPFLAGRAVTTRIPDDLPLVVFDPMLVEQVVINLLENAVKHTGPATPIEVSAAVGDGEVVVEVADRGPGIPLGDEARIFEKFYRGSHPPAARGAGLGLAICRAIVEAHGGRAWAENRPGGGAVFRFSLPLNPPTDVAPPGDGERTVVEARAVGEGR